MGHKPQGLCEQITCRERLLPVLGMVGTRLKSKCSDASQGPILQAGLSEDGRLKFAMLTLLHSYSHFKCLLLICFYIVFCHKGVMSIFNSILYSFNVTPNKTKTNPCPPRS